jgi:TRAP-type C4-dicarboxylate transport system permease small subunit
VGPSLRSFFPSLEKGLNWASSLALLGMMFLVTADVGSRYLFNSPITGTLEFTEFAMIVIIYLGLAYTQFLKAHIKIDFLIVRMPRRMRGFCDFISYLTGAILFGLIVWNGTGMFIYSFRTKEVTIGTLELPIYPVKFLIPVGSLILTIRFLIDMKNALKGAIGREG